MIKALIASILFSPVFLIPAFTTFTIGYLFFRKRLTLSNIDLNLFIYPWVLWISLIFISGSDKTLSNAVMEPITLGVLVGSFQIICMIKPKSDLAQNWRLMIPLIMSVTIWFFFPSLPK